MAKNNAAALPAWRCLYLCNLVNLWTKFLIFTTMTKYQFLLKKWDISENKK